MRQVIHWTCQRCQMQHPVYSTRNIYGHTDIMLDEPEPWNAQQVADVLLMPSNQIVNRKDFVAFFNESITNV